MAIELFHAMMDDRSGNVTVIACRASQEGAHAAAVQAEGERRLRDINPPAVTWVEPAPKGCGHWTLPPDLNLPPVYDLPEPSSPDNGHWQLSPDIG